MAQFTNCYVAHLQRAQGSTLGLANIVLQLVQDGGRLKFLPQKKKICV